MTKIDLIHNKTNKFVYEKLREHFGEHINNVMEQIYKTPVPLKTFLNLESVVEELKDFKIPLEYINFIIKTVSFSPFLTNILKKSPAKHIKRLFFENKISKIFYFQNYIELLENRITGIKNLDDFKKELREFKQEEFLRIGMQDICSIKNLTDIVAQLSDLAESFVEISSRWITRNLLKNISSNDFFILGMGKLGGRELNFSSDIDLIYIFSNYDKKYLFVNFFEVLTKIINDITEDGFIYRVDLRLRPDGENGAIAVDYESALFYYENLGRFWERAVMIKAKPIAGNVQQGDKFLKELERFIYRRSLDFKITDEILAMKGKINNSISLKNFENNIKLGVGGIREIEFIIQTIQLIYGGKFKELREKNTLKFLKLIKKDYDFLSKKEVDTLMICYEFLRSLEHKIQILHEKQTHSLPDDYNELFVIADYFGFNNIESFLNYQKAMRDKVHLIFQDFMSHKSISADNKQFYRVVTFDREYFHNRDMEISKRMLKILKDTLNSVPESNVYFLSVIFDYLFSELGNISNRERIVLKFIRLLEKLKFNKGYLSFMVKNRSIIKILVNIFDKSDYLSEILIKFKEAFEEVFFTDFMVEQKSFEQYINELKTLLEESFSYEDFLEKIRIFKHKENLRIGFNFLNKRVPLEDTVLQLSNLAEAVLQISVHVVSETVKEKFGEIDSKFAIFALGKFGGKEMNFESDLDLIFIFEKNVISDKGFSSREYFSKFLQRIISFLTVRTYNGILYEIDTRLRPSGNAGALVSSFDSFAEYHCKSSAIWEIQALLKARVVAGDKDFGEKVEQVIGNFILNRDINDEEIAEILRIRKRIETEEGKENKDIIDIKNGAGGIIDIEFLIQILLLKNKILEGNTFRAIKRLFEKGVLSAEEKEFFSCSYEKLREAENFLRLTKGKSIDKLKIEDDYDFIEEIMYFKSKVREKFSLYFKNDM